MSTDNNMINIGSSSQELDGRRPTAGGMPSNQEGNDDPEYTYQYNRAVKLYGKIWSYTSDKWKEIINDTAGTYVYGQDGYQAYLWDRFYDAEDRENRRAAISVARDKLQRELGPREFTLTYSPAWYQDDESAQDAMRVAIDKLTRYYKHDIIEFHAIGEYTEAGRAHVHCYYELDGGNKITDKNFKRAWPHWDPRKKLGSGHQGGHHANVRSKSDFLGYIEKDLEDAWMNVHITKNADDDTQQERSDSPSELSPTGRADDQEA